MAQAELPPETINQNPIQWAGGVRAWAMRGHPSPRPLRRAAYCGPDNYHKTLAPMSQALLGNVTQGSEEGSLNTIHKNKL